MTMFPSGLRSSLRNSTTPFFTSSLKRVRHRDHQVSAAPKPSCIIQNWQGIWSRYRQPCRAWLFLYSQAFCSWHRTTDPSSEDYQTSLQIWSAFNCQEDVGRCQKTCRKETSGEEQSGGWHRASVKSLPSISSLICAFCCLSFVFEKPIFGHQVALFGHVGGNFRVLVPFVCVFVFLRHSVLASLWIAVSYVAQAPLPARQHRRVSQVEEERGKHEVQLRAPPDLNVVSEIPPIDAPRPFPSSILSSPPAPKA